MERNKLNRKSLASRDGGGGTGGEPAAGSWPDGLARAEPICLLPDGLHVSIALVQHFGLGKPPKV